jgi:hypothetical protein
VTECLVSQKNKSSQTPCTKSCVVVNMYIERQVAEYEIDNETSCRYMGGLDVRSDVPCSSISRSRMCRASGSGGQRVVKPVRSWVWCVLLNMHRLERASRIWVFNETDLRVGAFVQVISSKIPSHTIVVACVGKM